MNNCRKSTELRREEILKIAVEIAIECGLPAVSGTAISKRMGVSRPAVAYHARSMPALRDDVMREAVASGILSLIAHGLSVGNPIATAAPAKLRRRAVESLL